MQPLKLDTD
ncbi:uncharacterized protein CELE_ZK377.15 [Caenorhabditis elegans]|uniref:Uncharacterized protein n=1 Tax=Caenorhabditis elegans TaxID=6239 RepID=A0A2K5AU27_CAEEL|nr:Uncharacterized protein CELE_ZK377.15 [Caenorhabditis elegans]SPC48687.1 Uncharacterized protein CELE_ZK377.15 [Caenorhabditis elegans]|eukprot:NP_001348826.1 Uncharacterized protein CELE_ZK377.15 [Caenorhabditis elegans]